jgi:uncharacterized protein YjbI with pentapeptide repeats
MAEDYRRAKLRGKSFKGQDLTGADFSYADIRGVDFTGAILKNVNFRHAQAGLQRRWAITIVILSFILSALSGFLSATGGSLLGFLLIENNSENIYVGIASLVVLSVFFLMTFFRGAASACGFLVMSITATGLAGVLWAGIIALSWAGIGTTTGTMTLAAGVTLVVTGAVSVIVASLGTVLIAGVAALAGAVAGLPALMVTILPAGVLAGIIAVFAFKVGFIAGVVGVTVAALVVLLSAYIACAALFGDENQEWVRNIVISTATSKGTNFENADLTDADLTQARLKNSNFNQAILKRTCWFEATELNMSFLGKSYLANDKKRELLVTKNFANKNFDGWDLQGLNLQEANFKDASLYGANLNESNVKNADFSRAKLVKTQLDKTDFTGANLTGAYIEDWQITVETRLDGVKCDYIFLRVPTKENPNPCRQPANWEEYFQPGQFSKFISPFSHVTRIKI